MPSLEARLKLVENALGLGLGSSLATLEEEVDRLKIESAVGRFQRANGNVLSGTIRTENGPGFSYIGPFVRDVDSTYYLEFELPIPAYMLRISRCNLHVVLRPVRSSVSVAESIGSQTSDGGTLDTSLSSSETSSGASTSSSTGASTASSTEPTTGASGSTGEVVEFPLPDTASGGTGNTGSGGTGNTGSGGTGNTGSDGATSTSLENPGTNSQLSGSASRDDHVHAETGSITGTGTTTVSLSHSHTVNNHSHSVGNHTHSGPSHTHSGPSHTHSGPSHTHAIAQHHHDTDTGNYDTHVHEMEHTHGIAHTHNIDHFHNIDSHTHDVDGHGHELTLAIAEGGSPSSVSLYVDGVDRSAALGGPWDDDFDADIRDYLVNARQIPVVGNHVIRLTTASVGALEVTGDWYGILKPPA